MTAIEVVNAGATTPLRTGAAAAAHAGAAPDLAGDVDPVPIGDPDDDDGYQDDDEEEDEDEDDEEDEEPLQCAGVACGAPRAVRFPRRLPVTPP
jgi:hypothetical protein